VQLNKTISALCHVDPTEDTMRVCIKSAK